MNNRPRPCRRFALRLAALAALGGLLPGCDSGPRAPVLRDDPVYQNDKEGFRFMAPQGWVLSARSEVPPGKVEKETTLVDYRRKGVKGASFLVTLIDLPSSTDLAEFLAGPSYGVKKWAADPKSTTVTAGGKDGVRHSFTGASGKEQRAKEVVYFRRGDRVYFFITVHGPQDVEARDQGRRVVDSLIWKR